MMDPSMFLDSILDDASEANNQDEEYQRRLIDWHQVCVAGLGGVSVACNAWILLSGAVVALHSKQPGLSRLDRDGRRVAVLAQLQSNPLACRGLLRMTPEEFNCLCGKLQETTLIRPHSKARVAEQLACFLFIIGQKFTHRAVAFMLCRSGQTISRFFHNILRAVISLEAELLKRPTGLEVAHEIEQNQRYYPYFKDCIVAIDETHVHVKVAKENTARYRGRKDWLTQNVLAVCAFDMRFTYGLAGWEGSASDSRVFKSALQCYDALYIPHALDTTIGSSSASIIEHGEMLSAAEEYNCGVRIRDGIALKIWEDYTRRALSQV